MKILFIDDDDRLRRVMEKFLRRAGHEILTAADGMRGMTTFRSERPDFVITDIVMPEQEGLGTIMMLRRESPETKIIAVSGGGWMGNLNVLEAARRLGCDDVISKPFAPQQLLDRINRLIGDKGAADMM